MIKGKNRYTEFKKRVLARPKVRESLEEGLDVLRLAAKAFRYNLCFMDSKCSGDLKDSTSRLKRRSLPFMY
ncbi:MAG: hypothetical protein ACRENW_07345 [Thermodesulfobacteriota bacterium]